MPAVSQYPTPTNFGGPGGPFWSDFNYLGPDFKVYVGPEYGDGSRDRNLESTAGVHKWEIEYDTTTDNLVLLDQHYQNAYGQAYGFNFYDHRLGVMFTNVHYDSYKRSKGKRANRGKRKVVLICEPS
jgi:hypothetical protein